MNERMRELLSQAGVHYEVMPKDTVYEKFAELIVRECATAITNDNLAKDCSTFFFMDSYAKGMRYSAHLIKQHFGVEE
jgi:hypothetical protein